MKERCLFFLFLLILLFSSLELSSVNFTNFNESLNFTIANSKIKLYSDNGMDVFSEGQSIELHGLTGTSKPYIGWYSWDPASAQYRGVGWLGCHYNLSNGNKHQHCSFETLENVTGTPTLNTKFEITYGSNLTKNDPHLYAKFSSLSKVILEEGVDLLLTGSASDIEGTSEIDLYPANQKNIGLRVNSYPNTILLQVLGGDILKLNDADTLVAKNVNSTGRISANKFEITGSISGLTNKCVLKDGLCEINNPKITEKSNIFCMTQSGNENLGSLHIISKNYGVGYTVKSTNSLANQEVSCLIVESL